MRLVHAVRSSRADTAWARVVRRQRQGLFVKKSVSLVMARPDVLLFVVKVVVAGAVDPVEFPGASGVLEGLDACGPSQQGLGGCGPPHCSSRSRPSSRPRVTVAVAAALATENRWLPHRTPFQPGLPG